MPETDRTERIKSLLWRLNQEGIRDRDVLMALATVPRERFVPAHLAALAWADRALPIEHEQTISQPLVVASMTQALRLSGAERVLEIGTGSGYQTAILCELAAEVVSVEVIPSLAETARARLAELGYQNVEVVVADGAGGWPSGAPYDRIIVTAAAPRIPAPLLAQLSRAEGARLVLPVGGGEHQELILIERRHGRLRRTTLGPVRFVPLVSPSDG